MAVVRDVFRMIGVEGLTMGEVQRRLNRRGIPSPMAGDTRRWGHGNSGKWSVSTIRKMVASPIYRPLTVAEVAASGMADPEVARSLDPEGLYGLWRWGRAYAPISLGDEGPPRAMVDAARERIGQGERRPPSTIAHRFWQLSGGIVRCGECGSVLSPKARPRTSGKIDAWYSCRQRRNNGARDCTHSRMYRADAMEQTIWDAVYALISDPDRLKRQHERALERKRKEMRGDPDREARDLLERLEKLERRRSGYIDLAADGDMSGADLRDKLAEVDRARAETEGALRSARGRQETIEEFERLWHLAGQLLHMTDGLTFLTASPEDRRRLYLALQLRADVDPDGTIRLSGIFDPEIRLLDVMQDGPADLTKPDPEPLEEARVVPTSYTSSPPRR
jgi:site-specific DNA recombinase